jgi:hypothetical protein
MMLPMVAGAWLESKRQRAGEQGQSLYHLQQFNSIEKELKAAWCGKTSSFWGIFGIFGTWYRYPHEYLPSQAHDRHRKS